MSALVIALIVKLVTFFIAKKSGASTTEAALLGLTAGGLTYAALDAADWDETNVKSLSKDKATTFDSWTSFVNSGVTTDTTKETQDIKDDEGNTIATIFTGTDGLKYKLNADGTVEQVVAKTTTTHNPDGTATTSTAWETATKEVGETLRSWGATGTSLVMATTKAATSSDATSTKWLLVAAAAVVAIIVLK